MMRFQRMLCLFGGSETERGLLERVVAMARNNQASLTVADVVPRFTAGIGMPAGGPISRDMEATLVAERTALLEAAVAPYRGEIPLATEVIVGPLFLEVIRRVRRHGHDLVIKVPEDPEWLQGLFGSDDMHLLRKCPCPVWLLKPPAAGAFRRVLAAVDVSPFHPAEEMETHRALNRRVLELAASAAMAEFAELHVVYAWQALAAQSVFFDSEAAQVDAQVEQERQQHVAALAELLGEARMGLGAQAWDYLAPHEHMPEGQALHEIPRIAEALGIDLVVMGTVGRTGIPGLFIGNTAEAILGQVQCSVLAIKPPGFVSPVQ